MNGVHIASQSGTGAAIELTEHSLKAPEREIGILIDV